MKELSAIAPIVLIALLFWLLIIRPNARRQRDIATFQGGLQTGDRVILAAGIYGTIKSMEDDVINLEVADGLVIRAARAAVLKYANSESEKN